MSEARCDLGVIGLGRMGGGLALQARDRGLGVIGFDPGGLRPELVQAGVAEARRLEDLRAALAPPRAVFVYIPAGPPVDAILDELAGVLERGDVIADGGNSYWGDSIRRHRRLAERGLDLVDLGTSGGVDGARHGACFMAGGERRAVERIEPILRQLAVPGGYVHAGPPGAGHFVKLVHNGIEFGMLQAIGEGIDLLERHRDRLDIEAVLGCWRNGSVIRGWLIELMHEACGERGRGGLADVPSFVEDTGEVNWLVADALRMEVPIPVIAQSVMQLFASRDDRRTWARAIAMMRHGFGGHPYGPSEPIADERQTGQVGGTYRDD
ncbi:MAG TPA: NADP-dependent phosphogluconate dehydrogenase [Kofleriaceae bacterium]|nr:NADP-dependent phosphogluconate dehydrogenase [Kofleriaceae bacterium]